MTRSAKVPAAVVCTATLIAYAFIPAHEGNSLKAYLDGAHVWTVCGGVAYVDPSKNYTAAQCHDLTQSTIGKFMAQVAPLVPADIPAETLAADTSLAYNVGIAAFSHSSTLKLQKKKLWAESCEAMLRFSCITVVPGKGDSVGMCKHIDPKTGLFDHQFVRGLWNRRNDERALCLEGANHVIAGH